MYRNFITALATILSCGAIYGTAIAQGYVWEAGGGSVKEGVAVKSSDVGGLTLSDTSNGSKIECKSSSVGFAYPEGKGEITALSFSECKKVAVCETGITATALNLPWITKIETVESKPRKKISNGGLGTPGVNVECLVLGLKIKDECTIETTAGMEDVAEGVNIVFDSKSTHGNCSIGGTGTGVITGTVLEKTEVEECKLSVGNGGAEACKAKLFAATLAKMGGSEFINKGEIGTMTFKAEPGVKEEIEGKAIARPTGPFTATAFHILSETCAGVTLQAGTTCNVEIEFLKPMEGVVAKGKENIIGVHPKNWVVGAYEGAPVQGEW